jgi:hypothetical protein
MNNHRFYWAKIDLTKPETPERRAWQLLYRAYKGHKPHRIKTLLASAQDIVNETDGGNFDDDFTAAYRWNVERLTRKAHDLCGSAATQ